MLYNKIWKWITGKMKKNSIFKEVTEGYFSHKLPNISAAIAFYGALSIAPLFIIITYLSAIIFGDKALKGELFTFLQFYVGSGSAQLIEKAVGYAKTHSSRLSLVFSMVVAVWGSALFFQEIRHSLHLIWGIKDKDGLVGFLGKKGYAITGVFIYGVIGAAGFGFYAFVSSFSLFAGKLTALVEMTISFFVLTFSFAVAYKFFSGAKVRWNQALTGASFSSALFICGRFMFSMYLKMAVSSSLYAAMGSLMTILLWLYFSSLIFLIGAEIAKAKK
jgi:membrane protein